MFRLTREVRFALNPGHDPQLLHPPSNSFAGHPSLTHIAPFVTLQATVRGRLDPASSYLVNIKNIDQVLRKRAIPRLHELGDRRFDIVRELFHDLQQAWRPAADLDRLTLCPSPFLSVSVYSTEPQMILLSQKFEFSASHRLFNPAFTDEQNRATYGKCSNPHGHGHNYVLQVTLKGKPDTTGLLIEIPAFERLVAQAVVERFDHRNLNVEVPEFRELLPSVENIAAVVYRLLKPVLSDAGAQLASVTVWETPKTWCEYGE